MRTQAFNQCELFYNQSVAITMFLSCKKVLILQDVILVMYRYISQVYFQNFTSLNVGNVGDFYGALYK